MLTSRNDAKLEERFASRIDVLMERVDTLAATVATTASAIVKKDGEIASLRRDLQARDETLQSLAAQARAGSPSGDGRELHELQRAVAALASERTKQGSSRQLEELAAKVGLLGQRLETLSATVSTTAAGLAGREGELATIRKRLDSPISPAASPTASPDPALKRLLDDLTSNAVGVKARLDAQAAELAALKAHLERHDAEPQPPPEELREMLATLRSRVEALAGLHSGVSEEDLDLRLAETDGAVARISKRVDSLAASVESATAGIGEKEHELAALHRHFTESSSRIEIIVDDIREALSAFPTEGPGAVQEVVAQVERIEANAASLSSRVERLEASAREAGSARQKDTEELAARIDVVDRRVAAVATEIDRAKTLWPVALRSLEARLDDAVHPPREATSEDTSSAELSEDPADDLLAGLRDSLHAMESVAEEMARASEAWTADDAPAPEPTEATPEAVTGGARIVPLRATDP